MRILVVEDDPALAVGLQRTLEAAGFECDVVHDGRSGCEQALTGDYALIVLDILLPGLNGFRICELLREEGSKVPVLMLTAKIGEWDEAEGLDTGADDYLTKPASMVVFVAHVRALIRRSLLFEVGPMAVGGITLDPIRRVCEFDSLRVSLSGREVEVLAMLMKAAGRPVDKDDLLSGVWGPDFSGDRNIVEVYVRRLRKKLDPVFGRPVVATVHRSGYRFCPSSSRECS